MEHIPWAGSTANPSLRGVNLVRTFGDGSARRAALQQVTIDLFPGQIALLMGPSGSGKSTLLAILSGLLEPDSGQVFADDDGQMRDVWQMTAKQREGYRRAHAGFIFQGYNLFPALTARQQLEIVLKWGEGAGPGDGGHGLDHVEAGALGVGVGVEEGEDARGALLARLHPPLARPAQQRVVDGIRPFPVTHAPAPILVTAIVKSPRLA